MVGSQKSTPVLWSATVSFKRSPKVFLWDYHKDKVDNADLTQIKDKRNGWLQKIK